MRLLPRRASRAEDTHTTQNNRTQAQGEVDWVAVDESTHGETIVGDGQGSTAYLIGVSETQQILAVTLSAAGVPTSYTTVQGVDATSPFNAGWAIYDEETRVARMQVFGGWGGHASVGWRLFTGTIWASHFLHRCGLTLACLSSSSFRIQRT